MNINYLEGDLFQYVKESDAQIVIPHVCNDKGKMGAGFVVPLVKNYPSVKKEYEEWFHGYSKDNQTTGSFALGEVQFIPVNQQVVVANMIAQTLGGKRPLFYNHLAACMDKVYWRFIPSLQELEIYAPMFGSGLAGGDWNFIEELIRDCWSGFSKVNICYLPEFLPKNWAPPEK